MAKEQIKTELKKGGYRDWETPLKNEQDYASEIGRAHV